MPDVTLCVDGVTVTTGAASAITVIVPVKTFDVLPFFVAERLTLWTPTDDGTPLNVNVCDAVTGLMLMPDGRPVAVRVTSESLSITTLLIALVSFTVCVKLPDTMLNTGATTGFAVTVNVDTDAVEVLPFFVAVTLMLLTPVAVAVPLTVKVLPSFVDERPDGSVDTSKLTSDESDVNTIGVIGVPDVTLCVDGVTVTTGACGSKTTMVPVIGMEVNPFFVAVME